MLLDSLLQQVSSGSQRKYIKSLWPQVCKRVAADARVDKREGFTAAGQQLTHWRWIAPTLRVGHVADFDDKFPSPFPADGAGRAPPSPASVGDRRLVSARVLSPSPAADPAARALSFADSE